MRTHAFAAVLTATATPLTLAASFLAAAGMPRRYIEMADRPEAQDAHRTIVAFFRNNLR